MLKYFSFPVLLIVGLGSLSAQTFTGKLNPFPYSQPKVYSETDTLKILAVMVNFQGDNDAATFGNGKFGTVYSKDYGNSILDPLPHDKAYFEAHLEFAKNYFKKVSNGKLNISYTVLPDTFSVSKTMRNYSPPNKSNDFTLLGEFASEVWQIADQHYSGFNFGDYDLFAIFHAGVGRDISLPGSIENEKDLPSIYLSSKSLKEIFGSSFQGFSVSGGSFLINNTMILPETQNREVESFGQTYLYEITFNGLLAANIASHLGLPDLFDTETGLSAIGRFGLMDGEAIFAYNGVFPPEPSAWEKIYLGWAEPVTVRPGEYNINLITNIAASTSDTVILKVPINSTEYFLVENRIRDANKDGAIITYILAGDTLKKVFTKDTSGFYSFSVDSIDGVVIDVDEFDWAIPNLKGIDDDSYIPLQGGGIVIWHIDEKIIKEKMEQNKINADRNKRGIAVEEADGIYDIGERFVTIFGTEVVGGGTIEDYWYASNPSKLFKNKFDKNTRPNTNSNSGANSLISFYDFSEIDNRMSFKLSYGDSIIKPLLSISLNQLQPHLPVTNLTALINGSDLRLYMLADENLYKLNSNMFSGFESYQNFSNQKVAAFLLNNVEVGIGVFDSLINVNVFDGNSVFYSKNVGELITAPPVVVEQASGEKRILIGTDKGKILIFTFQSISQDGLQFVNSYLTNLTAQVKKITGIEDYFAFTAAGNEGSGVWHYFDNLGTHITFSGETIFDLALTKDKNGSFTSILLLDNNKFAIISEGKVQREFIISGVSSIESFAVADLKQDGENYIIFSNGNEIDAVNLVGSRAVNFPFADPLKIGFGQTPLAADFEGDKNSEVVAVTKDGRIFAIDGGSGKIIKSFPLSIGNALTSYPSLFNLNGKAALIAVNESSDLIGWTIGSIQANLFWSEANGNNMNSAFLDAAGKASVVNEFMPKNLTYNYPNPVYDGETFIRFYVSENSIVNIKIFDLAGDLVDELNHNAAGGMDNEIKWNVRDIQSGVYLARVEAKGQSGKTETNVIKIAVVK
jgi:hypothetical protein